MTASSGSLKFNEPMSKYPPLRIKISRPTEPKVVGLREQITQVGYRLMVKWAHAFFHPLVF